MTMTKQDVLEVFGSIAHHDVSGGRMGLSVSPGTLLIISEKQKSGFSGHFVSEHRIGGLAIEAGSLVDLKAKAETAIANWMRAVSLEQIDAQDAFVTIE